MNCLIGDGSYKDRHTVVYQGSCMYQGSKRKHLNPKKNLERIIQVNLLWERLQDLTRYPTSAPSQ